MKRAKKIGAARARTRWGARRAAPVVAAVLAAFAGPAVTGVAQAAPGPEVFSWGAGDAGQLGSGGTGDRWSPGPVMGLHRGEVRKISAGGTGSGESFAVAQLENGTVRAWGHGSSGQLGTGSRNDRGTPDSVNGLRDVSDVAAGGAHALAISKGRVWAWGDNGDGQLGNNRTGDDSTVPVRVPSVFMARQVAAGCDFSLALMEDGTVWSWGSGARGQLGTGDRNSHSVPQEVKGLKHIAEIAAGCHHGVARTEDGAVWTWGDNLTGQLGDGTGKGSSDEPVKARWLRDIRKITAGADHSFAIRNDDTVYGWGENRDGQLLEADQSDDTGVSRTNRNTPVAIDALEGARDLAAGRGHDLAILDDKVVAWGANTEGQLGDGTARARFAPVTAARGDFHHVAASLAGNTSYAY
ncbi:RCC1 domain-containing protein [Streptomyces noursei]|uniref:RCC1 domain-containing protein n=1 Tax=Streptomyces noursei TaxID=1971 RepID=UPI000C9B5C47|nr:sialidase [Streptomyces noursei]